MTQHTNKPFLVLLIIAVAIGVGIGGVFAGGVALGKSSGEDTPTPLSRGEPSANPTDGAGQRGQGQGSRGSPGQFSRAQDGQVPPDLPPGPAGQVDSSATGSRPPGPTAGDAAGQRFPGRGGVSGAVEKVDGNLLTITTAEGPVEVTIAEATAISQISEAGVDDLQPGVQVTVMGPAAEDGRVEAATLLITPEGLASPFGRGQRGGRNSPQGAGAP